MNVTPALCAERSVTLACWEKAARCERYRSGVVRRIRFPTPKLAEDYGSISRTAERNTGMLDTGMLDVLNHIKSVPMRPH